MAQPSHRRASGRTSGRATRADSIVTVGGSQPATPDRALSERQDVTDRIHLPPHYFLAPTDPTPFKGTLENSLDYTLEFGRCYPDALALMDVIRQPVTPSTNWARLLLMMFDCAHDNDRPIGRLLLEDLFFLVTRLLLPEQIAQNRKLMARMYEAKRTQSIRTILRYDMMLEWTKRSGNHYAIVESRPLPKSEETVAPIGSELLVAYQRRQPGRVPLCENVWPTLLAGPREGWGTFKRAEAMKHHVTELDKLLMYTDEEVDGWMAGKLLNKTQHVLLMWQWLRKNTEKLEDMEVDCWRELGGRADECGWVRDLK